MIIRTPHRELVSLLRGSGLLILGIVCGFLGYRFLFTEKEPLQTFTYKELPDTNGPDAVFEDVFENTVPSIYRHTPLKTIAIISNNFTNGAEKAYIVRRRGVNDDYCGGMYSTGKCHLFLESSYSGAPIAKYIGVFPGSFDHASASFVDVNVLEYTSSWDDAGATVKSVIRYDMVSKTTTTISTESCEYDFFTEENRCFTTVNKK